MGKQTVCLTGILGQGASYAADKYLENGYKVIGLHRRSSSPNLQNVKHLLNNEDFILYEADICDTSSISEVITKFKPDLWLNFAAQSHVGTSYNQPIVTAEVNYLGVAKTLECIRTLKPDIKFWQASTSERYGNIADHQGLDTPPSPISPYAVSKVASEFLVKAYRQTYNLFACYGIMFNYESPRRSKAFVTRKISDFIGRTFNTVDSSIEKLLDNKPGTISVQQAYDMAIDMKIVPKLQLGNIDSQRSWTHCKDTIDGVFAQMNLDEPVDMIFGLEETHSVKEFLTEAFAYIGVSNWSNIVNINEALFRPSDVRCLKPDCSDAREIVGWSPKYTFKDIVADMVSHDIQLNSIN